MKKTFTIHKRKKRFHPNDRIYILIQFSNRTSKETNFSNKLENKKRKMRFLKIPKNKTSSKKKKKKKLLLSFKFSNVFKKIASSPVQFVWCRDKQIQSFSKPPKTLNLHAYVYFGFKITRHLCRDQKNGISVNGMRRDVCNSGDVIGRGGFKRSSRAPTFRGLWYAKIRQQRMHKSSSRELESEKKRERGGGERKWKRKKRNTERSTN